MGVKVEVEVIISTVWRPRFVYISDRRSPLLARLEEAQRGLAIRWGAY